jgi:hypothetical protein
VVATGHAETNDYIITFLYPFNSKKNVCYKLLTDLNFIFSRKVTKLIVTALTILDIKNTMFTFLAGKLIVNGPPPPVNLN